MATRSASFAAAVLLMAAVAVSAPAKLPPEVKTCKQTDPQYNECLKNALQDVIPTLVKGIPRLGVQPVDPLKILALSISEGTNKPVAINLDFTDTTFTGLASTIIDSMEMTPGSYEIKIKAHTTQPVTMAGNYKINGKILVLPVQGEGDCKFTMANPIVEVVLKGAPLEQDGETYFDVKDFKISFTIDRLYLKLNNLFNGDEKLGEHTNKFLNDNWEEILEELRPTIEELLSLSFKDIANHLFHKVPYNDIFPPK